MIDLKPNLELGVVPTHLKFVGGLAPDETGKLPRSESGRLFAVAEMARLYTISRATINSVQVPVFPGMDADDTAELLDELKRLNFKPHIIMMVAGGNPMDPADEDTVAEMLVDGLNIAKQHGVEQVSSTSVEEWMKPGAQPLEGDAFQAAVAQNVKVHCRAYQEAGVASSCIKAWHIEFLRHGEFQTFTSLAKIWEFVRAANESVGSPFFKVLVDAAHCGDSGLSMEENAQLIGEIADARALGMFHASAKTTRGCLSTDDGWIANLLTAAAATGKLEIVMVELFHHEDPALEGLRQLDPGHGIDTTDGRSYSQAVCDGLVDIVRRLNNLVARGVLAA